MNAISRFYDTIHSCSIINIILKTLHEIKELGLCYFNFNLTKSSIFAITGGLFLCFVSLYCGKIWYSYKFFKKRGIKTPKYEFFYGNFREIQNNYSDVLRRWTESLGKTYGYYEGHLPILVTSDLDIIQHVFIKQYANFSGRKKGPLTMSEDSSMVHLLMASKSRWKRMRTIMNPTFSSSKLRDLSPLIAMCTERLINALDSNVDKEFDITNFYKRFTMDTIWNAAFGVDIDFQNNPDNIYFEKCESVIKGTCEFRAPQFIGTYFHEIREYVLPTLMLFSKFHEGNPFFWMANKISHIVEKQKNQKMEFPGSKKKNLLQLLIEAECSSFDIRDNDFHDFKTLNLNKKLTTDEIKMNMILMMLAGYETTSSTLSYCTYILAKHPIEQLKLVDEINFILNKETKEEIDADSVNKLNYLDMFIKEVLRMYPIGNFVVVRRCTNPTQINGIDIPLDLEIAIDVLSLHYDSEIWGPIDPNVFYPERFSPDIKRNPLAFMSFGQGPRNCIGMKFAILELKICLVKLLQKYEIHETPNTPNKLEFNEGSVRVPKNGIMVILTKRS